MEGLAGGLCGPPLKHKEQGEALLSGKRLHCDEIGRFARLGDPAEAFGKRASFKKHNPWLLSSP
jgi:hypothetical protein